MKKFFKYNQSTHEAEATLIQKGIKVTAKAKAHEEDLAYANQFTGLQIAEFRALIKLLEKRARRKLNKVNVLRNDAQFLEDSANVDIEEAQELRGLMAGYIMEKDSLYKNLKNPPERIKWNSLDEDMLKPEFKNQLEEIKEVQPELTLIEGGKQDGKAES